MTVDPESGNATARRAYRRLKLEGEKQALLSVKNRLDSLRFWSPAPQLSRVVGETLSVIDELEERLEAKAIVAVVGGTGTGKSTLVNALCGRDDAVVMGNDRPTTRKIAALSRTAGDADVLVGSFGADEISVKQDYGFRFHDVVIVDTPDTDSSECADYSLLLDRVLQKADALICIFSAQNPKRRDNLLRLAAKVSKYKAEHVFLVLNQCDRIPEQELDEIRKDFEQNVRKSWTKTGKVFCVSARSSLEKPQWPKGESPLHGRNDFELLCSAIMELDGSHFADRRIERARELRRETEDAIRCFVRDCGDWNEIHAKLQDFESDLAEKLVKQEADRLVSRTGGLSALLYRDVAERWHGPIGLYLHVGLFVRSAVTSLRYLNPLNWPGRVGSKLKDVFGKKITAEESLVDDSISFEWDMIKGGALEQWPTIGPVLVNGFRMSPDLIDAEKAIAVDKLEESLRSYWPTSIRSAIDKMAKAKSRPLVQIISHLPLASIVAYSLYELLVSYFQRNYFSHDYYPHLCAILILLWLLPSWLVQSRVGGAGAKIHEAMKKELLSTKFNANMLPVLEDVDIILTLCDNGPSKAIAT